MDQLAHQKQSCVSGFASHLNLRHFAIAFAISMLRIHWAQADILFEGYSKVLLDEKHVGYVVQRYEFDNKKKEFITAYYLKTNQLGGNITESLKARSSANLTPVAYQYTELVGEKSKTIDAQFKGDMMTATIMDAGKKQVVQKKIPKGSFLSSFLAYVMLQGKEGIKTGVKYSFLAIAEEDAALYNGETYVKGEETVAGISAFKVLNTFKDAQFVSYCTYKGDLIATRSPVQKIATELVATPLEATAGMQLNSNALTQIFGSVPRGMENPVSRRGDVANSGGQPSPAKSKTLLTTPTPSPDSAKADGVPAGQGIQIKGTPDSK